MKFKALIAAAAYAVVMSASSVFAQGTAPEAKAMLEKAVTAIKADKAAALANFVKKDGGFQDRDLYVFCYNTSDGKFTAHVNPKLMGTDIRALVVNGQKLGEDIFKTAKPGATATVDYMFPKPGTDTPAQKQSFVTQVGDQGCGVGYYK